MVGVADQFGEHAVGQAAGRIQALEFGGVELVGDRRDTADEEELLPESLEEGLEGRPVRGAEPAVELQVEHDVPRGQAAGRDSRFRRSARRGFGGSHRRRAGCELGGGTLELFDVGPAAERPLQPYEPQAPGDQLLEAGHAVGGDLEIPGVATVAAFHRVGRRDSGHEEGGAAAGALLGEGQVNVAEQPGRHARGPEILLPHVEIAALLVHPETLDVPVGDPDVDGPRLLRSRTHPVDERLLAELRRTGTGIEPHRLAVDLEGRDLGTRQKHDGPAAHLVAERLPEAAAGALVEVMVARQDEHGLAGEPCQHLHGRGDVLPGDVGPIEEIAGHDEKVGLPPVRLPDDPPESFDPLRQEPLTDGGRVLITLEGDADVVVGGVDDADRHDVRLLAGSPVWRGFPRSGPSLVAGLLL